MKNALICILVLGMPFVAPTCLQGKVVQGGARPQEAPVPSGWEIVFLPVVGNLKTGIEIMNVGDEWTYVDIWYYDEMGASAGNDFNFRLNAKSSVTVFPSLTRRPASGVIVSYKAKREPTGPFDWGTTSGYTEKGEEIAAICNRMGPEGKPAAAYMGIGLPLLPANEGTPGNETYWIYAPVVQKNNNGWNTTIWLQKAAADENADAADIDIYYYGLGGESLLAVHGVSIKPLATMGFRPPAALCDGFVGSCWIRSQTPIIGIADEYNAPFPADAGILMSYRVLPKNRLGGGRSSANFNFGPLIFSQYNGWKSGIALLNSSENLDADAVVTFYDRAGTPLHTINTTLEERSELIIYPLARFGLPVDQIGSVSIEAQNYQPPGGPPVTADNAIIAVINQFNPTESKGSAYNAFRAALWEESGHWDSLDTATYLAAPLVMRYVGGVTPDTGWSTGLVIMNTDITDRRAKPIQIDFWDAAGGPVAICSLRINLRGGATHVIDCRYQTGNTIPSGWVGSVTIDSRIGKSPVPPMGGIVNEIYDPHLAGDFFMTYEMHPLE